MKVFISGKMTGDPDYKEKFESYAVGLSIAGYDPVNPTLPEGLGSTKDYLLVTIPLLATCDAIFLIPDWIDSPGAKAEKAFAEAAGMEVIACTI